MKVIVTRDDIDQGRRRDPNDCAVARALRRAGVAHSGVTGMLVFLDNNQQRTSVLLPGPVQEWIVDFDWGAAVEPIEFDLTLPSVETPARTVPARSPNAKKPVAEPATCEAGKRPTWSDSWRFWRRDCAAGRPVGRRQEQPKVEEFEDVAA